MINDGNESARLATPTLAGATSGSARQGDAGLSAAFHLRSFGAVRGPGVLVPCAAASGLAGPTGLCTNLQAGRGLYMQQGLTLPSPDRCLARGTAHAPAPPRPARPLAAPPALMEPPGVAAEGGACSLRVAALDPLLTPVVLCFLFCFAQTEGMVPYA